MLRISNIRKINIGLTPNQTVTSSTSLVDISVILVQVDALPNITAAVQYLSQSGDYDVLRSSNTLLVCDSLVSRSSFDSIRFFNPTDTEQGAVFLKSEVIYQYAVDTLTL